MFTAASSSPLFSITIVVVAAAASDASITTVTYASLTRLAAACFGDFVKYSFEPTWNGTVVRTQSFELTGSVGRLRVQSVKQVEWRVFMKAFQDDVVLELP